MLQSMELQSVGHDWVTEHQQQLHFWWKCKLIQPLWRIEWWFLNKLKLKLPSDPATPLLSMYPEKATIKKDTCASVFIAVLFTVARTWKQPRCPLTDEWIKKTWYIHGMEYYSVIKKEWIWVCCSEVDVEPVIQSEESQRKANIIY